MLFLLRIGISDHPKLGKPGKISGTRELIPHESYRLVYEIEGETLWILVLIHTAVSARSTHLDGVVAM